MRKNKKIISMSIIILSVVLLILIFALNKVKETAISNTSDISIPNGLQNKYPTNTISVSQKYKGNLQMNEISTKISEFMTGTIPFLKQHTMNMKEEEISNYYNENVTDIRQNLGNLTEIEFLSLIQYIQQLPSEQLEYESAEYIKESIVVDGGELEVKLKIKYKNQEEIFIKVHIPGSSYLIKFAVYE